MKTTPAVVLAAVLLPLLLRAQNTPHLGYVYPTGGRQGTTFQVVIGGQFLNGPTNLFVSGDGIQGRIIEYTRPLTGKEASDLREKLKELQDKRAAAFGGGSRRSSAATNAPAAPPQTNVVWTAEDRRMLLEIRDKLQRLSPNRQANPAISESVVIQLTVAANAEPGRRELRLGTQIGLSNPLQFCIGQWVEYTQRAANSRSLDPSSEAQPFREPNPLAAPREMTIALPSTINGQIMPGGVDRFRFHAHQGQHLVLAAAARSLIPYLADAVPGWFQASLTLSDAKGNELDHADHFRFQPDPVLLFAVPKDGDYVLEIRDSIYRGREDFVYRITAGELPFLTGIFPMGAPAGSFTQVELSGWNLPTNQILVDATVSAAPPLALGTAQGVLNPAPFELDRLPECTEQEPNNDAATAQRITLPAIINGRIDPPGDMDVFRFDGEAGSQIVAEIMARRLDSPLDSMLRLTDAAGHQLAFNDDHEDKGFGLNTHHADSYLTATLPARGTYYLHLSDAQHQGGPEFAYRLRISPPQPDFALRLAPSSLSLRAGATAAFTVFALRKDGFTNAIALVLKNPPPGFVLGGGGVPAGQDKVSITLTAPAIPQDAPFTLALSGRAIIDGESVIHAAVPADDMMQAFAYRHLVPANELKVAVTGRGMGRGPVRILGATPIKIPAGGAAKVELATPRGGWPSQAQLELTEAPDGLKLQKVVATDAGAELQLQCDGAKAKPGLCGNLIVGISLERPAANGKAPANRPRSSANVLPAIPFEIVAP